jgi:hypothetical protein
MSILPISNIINVTITNTPSGLAERNVNTVAIFTNEATNNFDLYREYVSASQVAADYGTSSKTARMANALFSQTPNIRTGNGSLVIIPMLAAVSATRGDFASANLSANLASIIAVTNGDLRVTIDSENYDLTGLNFTQCDSWEDIAELLQAKLVNATVTAIANGIRIYSKKVGTSSTVALAAVPSGTGTALNGSGYFNAAGGTSATGTNSSGETILQAIARSEGAVGYVGMMTTLELENAAFAAIASGVQAMDKMFFHHFASTQDIAGAATTNKTAGNFKTRPLLYTAGLDEALLMKAAYVGRAFSVNFNGSQTSQTMNLKQLATITPDLGINQTLYGQADTAGIELYVSYDGVPSVYSTGGNDFFDNPYSDLALKFALETAGFNFLRQTNTKVPQTEQGMNGLKAAYAKVCERFIRNGCVAPGSWTSSETFGDPETFKDNILTRGYYIYSLPIVQQSAVEREARKAPLVQIGIKRAGAIHDGDVIVLVND